MEAILCQLQLASLCPQTRPSHARPAEVDRGSAATFTPPSAPCLHCDCMLGDGGRGRGGGSSGPTDNDSGYSTGPLARITANLTARATSRPLPCPTPIIKRNQQRPLLWPVLLLAGVLQGAFLSLPAQPRALQSFKTPVSLTTAAHSVHSTADSVRSPFKESQT